MQKRIAICIPTCKRPAGLRRLLNSLASQKMPAECVVMIVVVDNEGSLLTRDVCEESARNLKVPLTYCCEPRRGIPFVRNKALEIARQVADFLVFIDDDEVPLNGWLEHLVNCQETYNADAVSGPVVPHFTSEVPEWVRLGRFFDPTRYVTGTCLPVTSTGNVLLKVNILERIGGFDERYALTGDSDTDFFIRLYKSGGRIVWSDEAVVAEWIPPSRSQLKWLLARAYRGGTTYALLPGHKSRPEIIVWGILHGGKESIG